MPWTNLPSFDVNWVDWIQKTELLNGLTQSINLSNTKKLVDEIRSRSDILGQTILDSIKSLMDDILLKWFSELNASEIWLVQLWWKLNMLNESINIDWKPSEQIKRILIQYKQQNSIHDDFQKNSFLNDFQIRFSDIDKKLSHQVAQWNISVQSANYMIFGMKKYMLKIHADPKRLEKIFLIIEKSMKSDIGVKVLELYVNNSLMEALDKWDIDFNEILKYEERFHKCINSMSKKLKRFEHVDWFDIEDSKARLWVSISEVLFNVAIPDNVKQYFLIDFENCLDKIDDIEISDIQNLRENRNAMLDMIFYKKVEEKPDAFYLNMLIWNNFISEIQMKSSVLSRCFIDDSIEIKWKQFHKGDMEKYRSKITDINKKFGIRYEGLKFWNKPVLDEMIVYESKNEIRFRLYSSLVDYFNLRDDISHLPESPIPAWNIVPNIPVKMPDGKVVRFNEIYDQYISVIEDFKLHQSDYYENLKYDIVDGWSQAVEWLLENLSWMEKIDTYPWIENMFSEKLENVSSEDLIILVRQLFGVIPIAWDFVWWLDDLWTVLIHDWVEPDGNKLWALWKTFITVMWILWISVALSFFRKIWNVWRVAIIMNKLNDAINILTLKAKDWLLSMEQLVYLSTFPFIWDKFRPYSELAYEWSTNNIGNSSRSVWQIWWTYSRNLLLEERWIWTYILDWSWSLLPDYRQMKDALVRKIDELVEKSPDWDPAMAENAKRLIDKLFLDSNISTEAITLIADLKNILSDNMRWPSIKSLTHILESMLDASRMPVDPQTSTLLKERFWKITETDFMVMCVMFHDLIKSFSPASITKDILDATKWRTLASHQLDSANYLRWFLEKYDSDVYVAITKYMDAKWIEKSKIWDFVSLMARTIEWHWWNTEFIQMDTARAILGITTKIWETVISKHKAVETINDMVSKWFINQDEWAILLDKISNIDELDEIVVLIKKVYIQKFIENNVWKRISLDQIDIEELTWLCHILDSQLPQVKNINLLLGKWSDSWFTIEWLIDDKLKLLEDISWTMNKYLHTREDDPIVEWMRFRFNINDIQSYANPKTEWFRKLIWVSPFDSMFSSPINSSLAFLSELKFAIRNTDIPEKRGILLAMYYQWLNNIQKAIDSYKLLLGEVITDNAPDIIKSMNCKTIGEAYENSKKMFSSLSEADRLILRNYFKNRFEDLCINLHTEIIYPEIRLSWWNVILDGLGWMNANQLTDVLSNFAVNSENGFISLWSWLNYEERRILNKILSRNYPVVEASRLLEWNTVVNVSISWVKKLNDILWQKFVDNIIWSFKLIIERNFLEFNRALSSWHKWRLVRDDYKNITYALPESGVTSALFWSVEVKSKIIEELIDFISIDIIRFVDKMKLTPWESKADKIAQIRAIIKENFDFGIWESKVSQSPSDNDKLKAFYQAEIISRKSLKANSWWLDLIHAERFDISSIRWFAEKAFKIERTIIDNRNGKKFRFWTVSYPIVVQEWDRLILSDELLRYVRKYWDSERRGELNPHELMDLVYDYLLNLNSWFDFISPIRDVDKDFDVAHDINDWFHKWRLAMDHIRNTYKWTMTKDMVMACAEWKKWMRLFVDVKDMWIMNIRSFRDLAYKFLRWEIDENMLLDAWWDITQKFIDSVAQIKTEFPDVKIALWWDELLLFFEWADVTYRSGILHTVNKLLSSNWLRSRMSSSFDESWSHNIYDNLDKSTKLSKTFEEMMEWMIFNNKLQDSIWLPMWMTVNVAPELDWIKWVSDVRSTNLEEFVYEFTKTAFIKWLQRVIKQEIDIDTERWNVIIEMSTDANWLLTINILQN